MMAAAEAQAGSGAPGAAAGPMLGTGTVALSVSSSLNSFRSYKRYGTDITIAELKCKLELLVGSPASCMALELYGPQDQLLAHLDSDEAPLGSYPVGEGCRLHVIDRSGARWGQFEDVSQVEKYEMAESDYDKRTDSLRSFLRQRGLGRFDGEGTQLREVALDQRRAQEATLATNLPLGARCQVRVPGQPTKRATIMYVGQTDFKPGYWVGVRYDEPLGKHDGSVNGRRYFECQPKYGAFVKPQSVTPGDFPEEDDGLEEEL